MKQGDGAVDFAFGCRERRPPRHRIYLPSPRGRTTSLSAPALQCLHVRLQSQGRRGELSRPSDASMPAGHRFCIVTKRKPPRWRVILPDGIFLQSVDQIAAA
jgi:hypothetical protein